MLHLSTAENRPVRVMVVIRILLQPFTSFWLSWLHSQKLELLDGEAGTRRGRDAGKNGP